ncbi:MAG: amidohydrolase family protein [Alphaproteobacteria bacterium]|nr:amidohydrolase family protein [Alphaproteobacteria bacterium]
MAFDIVIRGGNIVDGTGADPVAGDVGIKDGRIAALGRVAETGTQEIDADGHLVTPGFIDLHTHLDAQIGWDPDLTPISWHGVTTALMGNCGVTFAPCKVEDRPHLAAMMETVEDIPRQAILSGLPWSWTDYGGYLDALEKIRPGINVAGLVGHSAVRWYVMGERSVEEQATPAEVKQMAEIVGQALDRGALGFSVNRFAAHVGPDGRAIPGTFAKVSELCEIAKAVKQRDGLMQFVGAPTSELAEVADSSGARVLFSYGTRPDKGAGAAAARHLDELRAGRDITAIAQVRGSGYMFGLQTPLPFSGGDTWRAFKRMDLTSRLAALKDGAMFARLVEEMGDKQRLPLEEVYYLGGDESLDYMAPRRANVLSLMAATGETWAELFLRLSRDTDGKGFFSQRMFCKEIDEVAGLLGGSTHVYPGLGDAGAHVSQVMDADWATFTLGHWVRREGLYSVGEAIRRFTSGPARVMNLKDRGTLELGRKADVNVIDFARLTQLRPEIVNDFPGGAPRYIQRARGYRATIVNGTINILNDELTGARAGQVLRQASSAVAAAA